MNTVKGTVCCEPVATVVAVPSATAVVGAVTAVVMTEREESTQYPTLMEMARKFEVDLGLNGAVTDVVEGACRKLQIDTEGLSLMQKAKSAHDKLYGGDNPSTLPAPTPVGRGSSGGSSSGDVTCVLDTLTGASQDKGGGVFDTRGVLYWLGTAGGTRPYVNPLRSGDVSMRFSPDGANYYSRATGHRQGDFKQASEVIVGHDHPGSHATMWSRGAPGAWFVIDLKGFSLRPTHYVYRGDAGGGNNHPRTWELQGSNDGERWTTLRRHERDETVTMSRAGSWALSTSEFFSTFRVLNQGAPNHLCCSGIEFYGTLRPPVPPAPLEVHVLGLTGEQVTLQTSSTCTVTDFASAYARAADVPQDRVIAFTLGNAPLDNRGALGGCGVQSGDTLHAAVLGKKGPEIEGTYYGPGRLRYNVYRTSPTTVRAEVLANGRDANVRYEMRFTDGAAWQGTLPAHVHGGAAVTWLFENGNGAFSSTAAGKPTRRFVRASAQDTIFDRTLHENGGPRGDQNPACIALLCLPCLALYPLHCLATCGRADIAAGRVFGGYFELTRGDILT